MTPKVQTVQGEQVLLKLGIWRVFSFFYSLQARDGHGWIEVTLVGQENNDPLSSQCLGLKTRQQKFTARMPVWAPPSLDSPKQFDLWQPGRHWIYWLEADRGGREWGLADKKSKFG
jgi:hypothetical protein